MSVSIRPTVPKFGILNREVRCVHLGSYVVPKGTKVYNVAFVRTQDEVTTCQGWADRKKLDGKGEESYCVVFTLDALE